MPSYRQNNQTTKEESVTASDYNQLVDSYADNVYRFVLKNLKDNERAKDIVQESFEKLWVNRGKVEPAKAKSYLFTIAYHCIINEVRNDKKQREMDTSGFEQATTSSYSDLNEVLHRAIALLPTDQRSVILLRDYEGYSYAEIEQITGLNESQVKVYIYRARLFLKQYIGNMDLILDN